MKTTFWKEKYRGITFDCTITRASNFTRITAALTTSLASYGEGVFLDVEHPDEMAGRMRCLQETIIKGMLEHNIELKNILGDLK